MPVPGGGFLASGWFGLPPGWVCSLSICTAAPEVRDGCRHCAAIRSERQVVHLGGRRALRLRLRAERRHIGHRGHCFRGLLLFGLEPPGTHVGVPAAVVFARFDIDRNRIGGPFAELRYVALLIEKGYADFARKFREIGRASCRERV